MDALDFVLQQQGGSPADPPTAPDPTQDPQGYTLWGLNHPGSEVWWDVLSNPTYTPYSAQATLDAWANLLPGVGGVADAYRTARQQVYDPARAALTAASDYTRPTDEQIRTLANLRWLADASRAGTQAALGVTLAPSWQGQPTEWFQPLWQTLYGGNAGGLPPDANYPGSMLPLESTAAGLGHFRDVAQAEGWNAAVEDARAQWRNAPGPFPALGLHGLVENAADPRNWVMGRAGAAANTAVRGLGLPWPSWPFPNLPRWP